MFGYKPTHGLMTDVATLKGNGMKCSAVNLSCGYYEPHTDHEFTDVAELVNCLDFVQHIIENCTDKYDYDMPAKKSWGGKWNDWYDWYDDDWCVKKDTTVSKVDEQGMQTSLFEDDAIYTDNEFYALYDEQVDEVYNMMEWAVVDNGYKEFDLNEFIDDFGADYNLLSRQDFENVYRDVLNVMMVRKACIYSWTTSTTRMYKSLARLWARVLKRIR
jgi:hypothetical protein